MKKSGIIAAVLMGFASMTAFGNELISKAPKGAEVYFINLKDGQTVSENFKVQFGLKGMGIAPAGVNAEDTGHHHLLINVDVSTVNFTTPLPTTEQIRHFGKGQTEVMLKLPKGKHTLQLLLGNFVHIPHSKPVMSKKINITVK